METVIFKTLIHSLWQGLILAIVTALILVFSNKASAKMRYNLLIGCLMLFSLSISLTFVLEWSQAGNVELGNAITPGVDGAPGMAQANSLHPGMLSGTMEPVNWINTGFKYFSSYATTIVLMWLLVICAKSVQLFAGLYAVKRIRNTQITAAGAYWTDRVRALSFQFGINRTVGIVQSGMAKVPMVVGHLKPLILIPIGLLNGLSAAEVESIICHELAHIKRRDYLVNILQSFMEIIFFFNPAVLWINSLIREEREHCCDDIAISNTNNKATYISALISCQEFQINPEYAMAASGSKDHLVQRVKRMVSPERPALNRLEKGVLAVVLVAAVTLTAAFSAAQKDPYPVSKIVSSDRQLQTGANRHQQTDLIHEVPVKTNDHIQPVEDPAVPGTPAIEKLKVLNENHNKQLAGGAIAAEESEPVFDIPRLDSAVINTTVTANPTVTINTKTRTKVTVKTGITAEYLEKGDYDEKTIENMIADMKSDGLISENKKFSFKLDKNDLLINNQKMPKNSRNKYTSKYLKRPDWILVYNYEASVNIAPVVSVNVNLKDK